MKYACSCGRALTITFLGTTETEFAPCRECGPDVEKERADAYEEGYDTGYDVGFEQGLNDAEAQEVNAPAQGE